MMGSDKLTILGYPHFQLCPGPTSFLSRSMIVGQKYHHNHRIYKFLSIVLYAQVGQCITCECNDNVDPSLGPVCDMDTGRCLNCLNNTIGFECQFCQPGYYGDPPSSVPCTRKTLHGQCNSVTKCWTIGVQQKF